MIGCSARLGHPETIQQLASAYLEAGTGLDQLIQALKQSVGQVVPGDWRGTAASAFQKHFDAELDSAAQSAARAHRVATAATTLAGRLAAARAMFVEAEMVALSGGYYIGENCWVYPILPTGELNADAGFRATTLVEQAQQEAEGARAEFRWALADTQAERAALLRPLIGTAMAIGATVGGGRMPRAGRRGQASVGELTKAVRESEIKVDPYRPTIGDPNEPTNARLGREIHQMLANADRPYEGQKLGGTDWEVRGVERTFGDDRRLDYVLVNDSTKQVKVFDYYTGPDEPLAHNVKGWNYQTAPDIQALVNQGYTYEYVPVYTWKVN